MSDQLHRSSKPLKPTFFILGAPRCGTTALFTYLNQHPHIFLPRYKELNYFAEALKPLWKFPFKTEADYLALFAPAAKKAAACPPPFRAGEAASLYLYTPGAAENIARFDPNAKLIITLRNPVDFVHSYHQLNLALRREDVEDFQTAWNLYDLRKQGQHIPSESRVASIVMYKELGLFGAQIQHWLRFFPRQQIKVVLLEDIISNPRKVYLELEAFLDVPDDGRKKFERVNENFGYSSRLAQALLHPSGHIYGKLTALTSHLNAHTIEQLAFIHKKIDALLASPKKRSALPPVIYNQVLDYFEDDIHLLSNLIQRDLSHWLVRKPVNPESGEISLS